MYADRWRGEDGHKQQQKSYHRFPPGGGGGGGGGLRPRECIEGINV